MSVILFVLGILLTGVGIVLVGFAVPINESAIGQTLITAGAIAIVGGPVLVGLGAAIAQLAQIAAALKARPASRTGRVAAAVQRAEEIFPDPHAVEARPTEARVGQGRPAELRLPEPSAPDPVAVEHPGASVQTAAASATALDRLRATMTRPAPPLPPQPADFEDVPLSPNGSQHPTNGSQHPTPSILEPTSPIEAAPIQRPPEPVARASSPPDSGAKEPRLDFLFRPRPTRPAPPEAFDSMWPKRNGRAIMDPARIEKVDEAPAIMVEPPAPVDERRPAPAAEERRSAPVVEERRAAPVIEERRPALEERRVAARVSAPPEESRPAVAILKSGVVDGMAYTLYADGSIEAQLPQGTVRFGSIAELRAHIENNS